MLGVDLPVDHRSLALLELPFAYQITMSQLVIVFPKPIAKYYLLGTMALNLAVVSFNIQILRKLPPGN